MWCACFKTTELLINKGMHWNMVAVFWSKAKHSQEYHSEIPGVCPQKARSTNHPCGCCLRGWKFCVPSALVGRQETISMMAVQWWLYCFYCKLWERLIPSHLWMSNLAWLFLTPQLSCLRHRINFHRPVKILGACCKLKCSLAGLNYIIKV